MERVKGQSEFTLTTISGDLSFITSRKRVKTLSSDQERNLIYFHRYFLRFRFPVVFGAAIIRSNDN